MTQYTCTLSPRAVFGRKALLTKAVHCPRPLPTSTGVFPTEGDTRKQSRHEAGEEAARDCTQGHPGENHYLTQLLLSVRGRKN